MPYISKKGAIIKTLPALLLIIALAIGCNSGNEQSMTTSTQITVPREINGWSLTDTTETYDRKTIFDYINGAGEVYLSYGFKQVNLHRYSKTDGPEIIVEIFDMDSAEDAFGIFSYARESEDSGIGGGYEYRGSLLCFWQDRYYVCILCYEQNEKSRTTINELAQHISKQLSHTIEKPDLITKLPAENLKSNTARFFHIHPTLNYHYFLSEQNILRLGPDTRAALAEYGAGMYLLLIEYPSSEKAVSGYEGFIDGYIPEAKTTGTAVIESGEWVAVQHDDRYVIICFDAPDESEAIQLINACKNRLLQ